MHASVGLLLELGILLIALSVLGTLARRLSLSPVPLYLVIGLTIGEGGILGVPASGTTSRQARKSVWCSCCLPSAWSSRAMSLPKAQTSRAVRRGGSRPQRDTGRDRRPAPRPEAG